MTDTADFVLGTRGSALARTQTTTVGQRLEEISGLRHELRIIRTEGDVTTGSLASLGGTGVFASALRAALLDRTVDIAVHSLKDLPAAQPAGLQIAAVPPRADPRDALCSRDGLTLADLPKGASVGTGSPRRAAQLLSARPDLNIVDIRGNVPTRLARVPGLEIHDDHAPAAAGSPRGDLDAVVLACSGLDRLGMDWAITERLDPQLVLPAPGQGTLAVEISPELAEQSPRVHTAVVDYDDPATRVCITAERALLSRLEAGCAAPLGALATVLDTETTQPTGPVTVGLDAVVAAVDGSRVLRRTAEARVGPVLTGEQTLAQMKKLGVDVAELLLADGADLLMGESGE